ncbi:small RNA degrading nuclease 5 [Thrips palmi]|uniref:Small RNA degrading nuclease 5 n=1 Tax=Thrips palmi TaxID=161013 RepID=A0A6P8ZWC1_THRPL|nr:small RNA degrading nuclease 5 [Thrips palmi]
MEHEKKTKQSRRENKMRKMAALVEIAQLNARDRMEASTSNVKEHSNPPPDTSDEPNSKKLKLSNGTAHSDDIQEAGSELVDESKRKYSEAEYAQLRAVLRETWKTRSASLILKESGLEAKLDIPTSDRVPIFLSDLQSLVLKSMLKNASPLVPRWCKLDRVSRLKSVRILFIEGAGISDYLLAKEKLPALVNSSYPICLEVIMPTAYCGDLVEEFCAVPMPFLEYQRQVKTHGSIDNALKKPDSGVFKILRAFFPVEDKSETPANLSIDLREEVPSSSEIHQSDKSGSKLSLSSEPKEDSVDHLKSSENTVSERDQSKNEKDNSVNGSAPSDSNETQPAIPEEPLELHPSDKFPRTALLLSAWQMIEEGYPLLLNNEMREKYSTFVLTKSQYKEVNNHSPMYGLDCEMCMTSIGASEVTRVGIVNEKHETVLDTLVLPYNEITNFLTKYSGITAQMMKNVTTRLEDVQDFIREYLEPDAILVGQSLQFDLKALKIIHPYCIDTSVIFNISGDRYRKSKLSLLSERFLGEQIQLGHAGHSPVEDSLASLKLVQLKLNHHIEFGDAVLQNQAQPMVRTGFETSATTNITHGKKKHSSLVKKKIKEDLCHYATSLFSLTSRSGLHATIVSTPDILEKYIDFLDPTTTTYDQCNSSEGDLDEGSSEENPKTGGVNCIIGDSNLSVVDKAAASSSFLTVGHIQLSANESDSLLRQEDKIVNEINHYISQMEESASVNTLSIVVLCGREKSSNGMCFIKLPKPKIKFHPKDSTAS